MLTRLLPLLTIFACNGDPRWLDDWSCGADEYATVDTQIGADHSNVQCAALPEVCDSDNGFEASEGLAGACLEAICPDVDEAVLVTEVWTDGVYVVDCDGPDPM